MTSVLERPTARTHRLRRAFAFLRHLAEMLAALWGHTLMPVFMIAVMVARRGEYTLPHAHCGAAR